MECDFGLFNRLWIGNGVKIVFKAIISMNKQKLCLFLVEIPSNYGYPKSLQQSTTFKRKIQIQQRHFVKCWQQFNQTLTKIMNVKL